MIRSWGPLMADKQCFASIDVNLTESPVPIQMYREFTKNNITFFWDEIKLQFFLRCVLETLDFIDKAKTNISECFHFFPILPLLGTSFLLIAICKQAIMYSKQCKKPQVQKNSPSTLFRVLTALKRDSSFYLRRHQVD